MTAARFPHACAPHPLTVAPLLDGSRSSMREVCKCGQTHTYILRNSDGAVIEFVTKEKR